MPESIAKLEPACEIAMRTLGPTYWRTLDMQTSLAECYYEAGRYRDRARLLETILAVQRKLYGPDSGQVVMSTINLSQNYGVLGDYKNCVRTAEELLAQIPVGERRNHINLQLIYQNLADGYDCLGDRAAAKRTILESEKQYVRPRCQPGSGELDSCLVQMADTLLEIEAYDDAERVSRELYELRKAKEDPGGWVAAAQARWGAALVGQKKYAFAEPVLVSSTETILKRETFPNDLRATAMRHLAALYAETGRAEKSLEICRREIARNVDKGAGLSDNDILVSKARWCGLTARIRKTMRDPQAVEEAKESADRAMQLLKQAYAAGHRDFANLRYPEFDLLRDREDYKKLVAELEEMSRPKVEAGPMPREKP